MLLGGGHLPDACPGDPRAGNEKLLPRWVPIDLAWTLSLNAVFRLLPVLSKPRLSTIPVIDGAPVIWASCRAGRLATAWVSVVRNVCS